MKLKKVRIKNFKSIKDIEFEFPESGIIVLVGENNSGKSNIIRSIDAICGEGWYGREKLEDRDYYLRDTTNQIRVDLYFDDNKSFCFQPSPKDWGVAYYKNWEQTTKMPFGQSIKDDFPCTYLGADRTLDKHLSFYDWTLIGRIRKAFHKRVSDDSKKELEEKFEEIIQSFSKVPGFDQFRNDFSNYYNELAPYSKSKLKIDFKPFSPANYFKTLQIIASEPSLGNKPIDLDELGEGARNLVLLSLLRSYAKNFKGTNELSGILALEEPELFLHPHARRHLFYILHEIAKNGVQVIISTHSSSFIDTEYFDEIGRVVKITNAQGYDETNIIMTSKAALVKKCHDTGVPILKADENSIVEFYKTTSNIRLNEGFFAKCLILVEGETEELALPEFLNNRGINCDALGISIISVNGKNQIPKYWRLYSTFNIPIIVIIDNDNTPDKAKSNTNISNCFGIAIDKILNFEGTNIALESMVDKTPLLILKNDFEICLKEEIGEELYSQYQQEAKQIIKPIGNQQKGVIARYIVRKVIENTPEYTPSFIETLIGLLAEYIPGAEEVLNEEKVVEEPLTETNDDLPF
jgi:putative ATP-dependent endonuclease of the OLD family